MRKILPLLAALVLPACAPVSEQRKPVASDTLAGPVIYQVSSWGMLLERWEVRPDGSGEIWRSEGLKGRGTIRKFRLRMDAAAMAAFIPPANALRRATRGGIPCKKEIFDLPYGSIEWDYPGAKQTFNFDSGCQSKGMDDAAVHLHAAQDAVTNLAAIDPEPYATVQVGNR